MNNDTNTETFAGVGPVERPVRPLPPGREYIAGMNRHFAKVCGTVIAYSEEDVRSYAAQEVAAERERFVEMLEYAMSLDGFGCACEPARKCGTCQARDTAKKVLGPLLRTLKA